MWFHHLFCSKWNVACYKFSLCQIPLVFYGSARSCHHHKVGFQRQGRGLCDKRSKSFKTQALPARHTSFLLQCFNQWILNRLSLNMQCHNLCCTLLYSCSNSSPGSCSCSICYSSPFILSCVLVFPSLLSFPSMFGFSPVANVLIEFSSHL